MQGGATPAGHDLAPPGSSAPPHATLLSPLTGMPHPDPRDRRTSVGLDLAPYGRRGAQRTRAPSEHHCLAHLDHPNALGWPSLSGHTGAPSAPPRADGGAHASTWRGVSVSQTCPVPAMPARDTCHCPCLRGTSTGRSKRPAGAGGGGEWGGGSGRGDQERNHNGMGGSQVSGVRSHRLPTPPPYRDALPNFRPPSANFRPPGANFRPQL